MKTLETTSSTGVINNHEEVISTSLGTPTRATKAYKPLKDAAAEKAKREEELAKYFATVNSFIN